MGKFFDGEYEKIFWGFRTIDNSQMRDFAFAIRSEREQVICDRSDPVI